MAKMKKPEDYITGIIWIREAMKLRRETHGADTNDNYEEENEQYVFVDNFLNKAEKFIGKPCQSFTKEDKVNVFKEFCCKKSS